MLTCSSVLDLNQTIPTMNLVALAVSIFLSIGIPIYAFLTSKRQFLGKWQTLFLGVADFLMIEFFLTNLILFLPFLIPGFSDIVTNSPLFYSILCVILIGFVGEIGRYFVLGFGIKESPTLGTAAMFATGTASARSFLLITWNALQSFFVCMTVNQTGLAALSEAALEDSEEMLLALEPLFSTSWLTYLSSGIDVAANFVLHFSLTMVLFTVLIKKAPSWLIIVCGGLRALYELPTYLYTYNVLLPSAFVSEVFVVLIAAAIGYFGWKVTHTYCAAEIANLHWDPYTGGKNRQTPFPKFNENVKK